MKTTLIIAAALLNAAAAVSAQTCVSLYGQCGGLSYTGSTTCCSGSTCVYSNDWYSQCLVGSATSAAATTTTTTRSSTTTTTTTRSTTTTAAAVSSSSTTTRASTTTAAATTTTTTRASTTTTTRASTTTSSAATSTSTLTAYTAPDGPAAQASGNPYNGVKRYVSAAYAAKVQSTINNYASNATRVTLLNAVKKIPTYTWLDTMSALDDLPGHLAAASAQGGSETIVAEFVIYDLPGRDCAALASNGEIPAGGLETYKTSYIDRAVSIFATKAANVRLVLVIEPDSLPNLMTNMGYLRCNSTSTSEYQNGVAYAIAKLSTLSNTYMYLDLAHGGWLGWPTNQVLAAPIYANVMNLAKAINPSAAIRGFATNTANYDPFDGAGACPAVEKCPLASGLYDWNPCIDENLYIQAMATQFASAGLPTRFITDTSRNGRNTIRYYWGSWCNIKGAGLGVRPQSNPASLVDAFVWVKPPGDSDGVSSGTVRLDGHCDPTNTVVSLGASGIDALSGAPQAGQWFESQFLMLVDNANPPMA